MAVNIVINNQTYSIPTSGANADWGEELTDAIVAIAGTLNTLSGPFDVLTSSASILNTATTQSPNGYIFSSNEVRSFESRYVITRKVSKQISSSTVDVAGVITVTTTTPHDLSQGDVVSVAGSNSTASINGQRTVTAVISPTEFEITVAPGSVTVAGSTGNFEVLLVQTGRVHGAFGMQGWVFNHFAILGDSRVNLNVNQTTGQIEVIPEILTGTNYSGTITFSGGAFVQD